MNRDAWVGEYETEIYEAWCESDIEEYSDFEESAWQKRQESETERLITDQENRYEDE